MGKISAEVSIKFYSTSENGKKPIVTSTTQVLDSLEVKNIEEGKRIEVWNNGRNTLTIEE